VIVRPNGRYLVLPRRAVAGFAGAVLTLATLGIVNASSSQADGRLRCLPTVPTLTLGAGTYGATYVTGGTLVKTKVDDMGDAVNCRYTGKKYTSSTYGSTQYLGTYTWWSKSFYMCATSPGTCTP